MAVYICGKVSGLDYEQVCKKFAKADEQLWAMGFKEIINPLKAVPPSWENDWESCMRLCLTKMLARCDTIYLLKDWTLSKGAKLEFMVASQLNFKIIRQE